MPIYNIAGISGTHTEDETAVVHVGNIRKGDKDKRTRKDGSTYEVPTNLDYFRVTIREDLDDLKTLFERQVFSQPRTLRVQLAYPNLEDAWWTWNSCYKSGGMLGLNDGVWWNYLRDPETNVVLVSDYMLTADGRAKIVEDKINGFSICDARGALQDYELNYHREELPLPRSWKKVQLAVSRGLAPQGLLFDRSIPIYRTGSGDKQKDNFSTPEGRLMLTMPHLEGFTSFHLLPFKTGSVNDIRTISQNLALIAAQHKIFDSDLGSVSLDAIPMILVRRKETITKMIDGKLAKAPEWLIHIQTVPRWQRFVDDMHLQQNVKLMFAAVSQEMSGLSMTVDHLELPETVNPLDELDEGIEIGEYAEIEETPEPEEPQAPKTSPAKKATTGKKQPAKTEAVKTKSKPRQIDPKVLDASFQGARALLENDKSSIDASQFWASVYGMGYDQKGAEKFLASENWRVCLALAVDNYESQNARKENSQE